MSPAGISTKVNKKSKRCAHPCVRERDRVPFSLFVWMCLVTFILRPLKVEQRIFLFGRLTNSGNCIMHDALGYFSSAHSAACVFIRPVPACLHAWRPSLFSLLAAGSFLLCSSDITFLQTMPTTHIVWFQLYHLVPCNRRLRRASSQAQS